MAAAAASRLKKKLNQHYISHYKCPVCKHYHVGHTPGAKRKKKP